MGSDSVINGRLDQILRANDVILDKRDSELLGREIRTRY